MEEPDNPDPVTCSIKSKGGPKIQSCSDENNIVLFGTVRNGGRSGVRCTWSASVDGEAVNNIQFTEDDGESGFDFQLFC